jgi:hypothetical protein
VGILVWLSVGIGGEPASAKAVGLEILLSAKERLSKEIS